MHKGNEEESIFELSAITYGKFRSLFNCPSEYVNGLFMSNALNEKVPTSNIIRIGVKILA